MVAGSLLERESRVIAGLLLEGEGEKTLLERVVMENLLQKRSIQTIKRQTGLLVKRLLPLGKDGWKLISQGSAEVTRQVLLAACIKHNRLLGDFVLKVVREEIRLFHRNLPKCSWVTFIEEAAHREDVVTTWSDSTKHKLGQVSLRILAEAGIIENPRNLKFLPFFLDPQVATYLRKHDEDYILKCLELS